MSNVEVRPRMSPESQGLVASVPGASGVSGCVPSQNGAGHLLCRRAETIATWPEFTNRLISFFFGTKSNMFQKK